MFGISFSKILVLVAVIAAVIFFFKFVGRIDRSRRDVARREEAATHQSADRASKAAPSTGVDDAEEMVACPVCSTYVAERGARNCGREGCPYR